MTRPGASVKPHILILLDAVFAETGKKLLRIVVASKSVSPAAAPEIYYTTMSSEGRGA